MKKLIFENVKSEFLLRNYTLLDEIYVDNKTKMSYICSKHEDKGILYIRYREMMQGHGCYWCGVERRTLNQTGAKSHLWKGGKTDLVLYLRERLVQWKEDSLKFYNGKCVISGVTKNLDIHHLYSFHSIIDDTLRELKLEKKPTISEYTEEELISIENKCLEIHYRHPLGVCLSRKLHREFHSIYGKDNNSESQFYEYISKYHNDINIQTLIVDGEKLKYFPYKLNSKSKYKYVNKIEKSGKWKSNIFYKRKRLPLGCFDSEYEAAEAYNLKALELFGINATLNLLDINDKKPKKPKKKFFDLKVGASSKYTGVNYNEYDMWVARIDSDKERYYLGLFQTEWMAAEAFNEKAIELYGEEAILNYITDEDKIKKENYIPIIKMRSSLYIGVTFVKRDKKWNAYIRNKGKRLSLGYYILEKDAAIAYNNKAFELYGDDAIINEIKEVS